MFLGTTLVRRDQPGVADGAGAVAGSGAVLAGSGTVVADLRGTGISSSMRATMSLSNQTTR